MSRSSLTLLIALLIVGLTAAAAMQFSKRPPAGMRMGRSGWTPDGPQPEPRAREALDEVVVAEDFEGVPPGELPADWTVFDGDSGYCSWFDRASVWTAFNRAGFSAFSGNRFIMCIFNDAAEPNDDWLILPPQELNGVIRLSYWLAAQDADYPEAYELRLSTTGAAPADFSTVIFSEDSVSGEWTYYEHDLSAWAGAPFRLAFHYNAVDRFMLKLDDLALEGEPPPSGAIAGLILSEQGEPLENASARIVVLDRTVRTDASGYFIFPRVPPGSFSIHVEHPYYVNRIIPQVPVVVADTAYLNIQLSPRPYRFYDYTSPNSPRPILDFDTASLGIRVPDTILIADLDVTVSLTHSYVGDLDIWLKTPDSLLIRLVAYDVYRDGENIVGCRFDDRAVLPFTAGVAPYTGRFRPAAPLSQVNGDTTIAIRGNSPVGNRWRLDVYDNGLQDVGTLYGFSMHVATDTSALSTPERPALPPRRFSFDGNYPNPFNSQTRFRFYLSEPALVRLVLYNSLGREVATILSERLSLGAYEVPFHAGALPTGLYFARLSAGPEMLTQKVLLLR